MAILIRTWPSNNFGTSMEVALSQGSQDDIFGPSDLPE